MKKRQTQKEIEFGWTGLSDGENKASKTQYVYHIELNREAGLLYRAEKGSRFS